MIETSITKWIKKKIRMLIGIVEDGDAATHSIASGKYVVWKGDLYKASTAIAIGTTLSSSNLTAVSDGGLNEIDGIIATLSNNLSGLPTMVNNSNGYAWKFPSGLMICTKSVSATCQVQNAWGSLYESKAKMSFGNFAVSFIATPYISATCVGGAMGGWIERVEGASASSAGGAYIVRPTTQDNTVNVHIVAVGRWK